MTYIKQIWADGVAGATPLSAERLSHMEDGIALASPLSRTAVKAAAYTAAPGELVPVDTATPNANITIQLPTAPVNGSRICVKHIAAAAGKTVTIARGGTDVFNKAGGATALTLTLLNQAVTVEYESGIWTVVSDDMPLSVLDTRFATVSAAWQPNTFYKAGQLVNNAGVLYSANADFTSGATFVGSNWTAVGASGGASVDTATFPGGTVVTQPPANPSPHDVRPVGELAVRSRELVPSDVRRFGRANQGAELEVDTPLHLGTRRNLWQYTEDLAGASRYSITGTLQAETIVIDGITLRRVSLTNFFHWIRSPISGLGLTPFVAGHRYLFSCYAMTVDAAERFFWMRDLADSGAYAHGSKMLTNRIRRIWTLMQANDTSHVDQASTPTDAWGAGANADPKWLFRAQDYIGSSSDVYVGGFQIEDAGTTYVDGIAVMGDSTYQGSAGTKDLCTSREISRYLEGILNVPVFDRGVAGNSTADMDARWATDITVIKHRCKYVIIEGWSPNDAGQSRSVAQVQTSVNSMVSKAIADGLIPIVATGTPSNLSTANEANRLAVNAWIKATFPRVLDVASVIEDPHVQASIRRDPDWYGDGTHFGANGKRAVAAYMANWPGWDFVQPAPYQPIAAATWTSPGAAFVDGNQVVGPRQTGWTAGTGTPNKGAFAADTATAVQAAQRVLALEQALRTHGLIN